MHLQRRYLITLSAELLVNIMSIIKVSAELMICISTQTIVIS